MAGNTFDLIAIGNISIDTIKIDGNSAQKVPGGSAAAVLTASSALSIKTGALSKVGLDYPSDWLAELVERGIDIQGVQKQKNSCRFELAYDDKGALKKFEEVSICEDLLSVKDFPKNYFGSRHYHLSASHPRNQEKFLKSLPDLNHGSTISLALWPTYEKEYTENFSKLLEKVDILFCNNFEAKILANEENIYDAVKKVKKLGPKIVVLTKGPKGSAIYHKSEFYLFPALRTNLIDRTGCGDSFAGGFLASYIQDGDVEKAGWAGTALASFTISKIGSWFPKEITNGKIDERIERAKKFYREKKKEKITLMEFF